MFCPRAGLSIQTQARRLQCCPKAGFHQKLRNQGCSFTRDEWIGAVTSSLFSHPTRSLASEFSTDLKRFEKIPGAPTWRWGKWIRITMPSGLHRNSHRGLNISSMRVYDQIQRSGNPNITLRPIKKIMAKIIYVSRNSYLLLKLLLYIFWNFYRKCLNILLRNLMRMDHFEIYILKLFKKLLSRKLIKQLNSFNIITLFQSNFSNDSS